MLRYFLVALASLFVALPAAAQTTRNCVTATCTIVCDAIAGTPAGIPTGVRLYSGATQLADATVAAPYACNFPPRNFAAGTYNLTARYYNATGEGPDSNVLTFTSAAPLPPPPAPTNLRFL